jgi:glycosyltransferase involved in cell wall biosynthesis
VKQLPYKLGLLTTHPIQYQVPWFRALTDSPEVDLTVFYCHLPDQRQQGDGFGVEFEWDIPLLEGYHYEVLDNVAAKPSVTRFGGCDTPGISNRIRSGDFDAFLVNGWVVKSCLQALLACRRAGVPCLVRGEANVMRPRPWWKRRMHQLLIKQYAAYLYIGSSNAEFYRRHGAPENRLFPTLYCVENERFAAQVASLTEHDALRSRWNIPLDSTVFLFCGKFIPKKHPLELLQALKQAHGNSKGLHLLMVGDGELREQAESFVRENDLPVTFAGFLNQSELAAAYACSDCLVLPSDYGETWGLVVNEAMATGLPAIVSDQAGCAPDLIKERETGVTFPFGDWSALGQCMADSAADKAQLELMGRNAKEYISAYSVDAAARGTLDAVRSLCG